METKFPLGRILATPGIQASLSDDEKLECLFRHASGDWGTLCPEDDEANRLALMEGGRLFSVYFSNEGQKFWIITEADRSATTFLLPEEY
jgi:hypothetical protein